MAILKIMEKMGDLFSDGPEIKKVAEFCLISVNPAYSGRRIARNLAEVI